MRLNCSPNNFFFSTANARGFRLFRFHISFVRHQYTFVGLFVSSFRRISAFANFFGVKDSARRTLDLLCDDCQHYLCSIQKKRLLRTAVSVTTVCHHSYQLVRSAEKRHWAIFVLSSASVTCSMPGSSCREKALELLTRSAATYCQAMSLKVS